jgi:putative FmdB family regulatory protein
LPTYVYECRSCEKVLEVEQRITEDPLKDCACGKKGTLRRVIQPVGVVFNGAGFHINDYSSTGRSEKVPTSGEGKTESAAPNSACTPDGCPSCRPLDA